MVPSLVRAAAGAQTAQRFAPAHRTAWISKKRHSPEPRRTSRHSRHLSCRISHDTATCIRLPAPSPVLPAGPGYARLRTESPPARPLEDGPALPSLFQNSPHTATRGRTPTSWLPVLGCMEACPRQGRNLRARAARFPGAARQALAALARTSMSLGRRRERGRERLFRSSPVVSAGLLNERLGAFGIPHHHKCSRYLLRTGNISTMEI